MSTSKKRKDYRVKALLLLLVGLLFIAIGVFRGEVFVVLTKAIHICLECIGIG
ncbi:MAG: CD1871A family CXXC motif-containing protein [Anaerovoracaceae bacterium]|nr:thioredoxin [Clostridiales bacterium]